MFIPGSGLRIVRSTMAHARITGIDVTRRAARRACSGCSPGRPRTELGYLPHIIPAFPEEARRPLLASTVVRYVGEPVWRWWRRTATPQPTAQNWWWSTTSRCRWSSTPRMPPGTRCCCFPQLGTNTMATMASKTEADFDGVRGARGTSHREHPYERRAPRNPFRGRVLARRQAHPLFGVPGRPSHPRCPVPGLRAARSDRCGSSCPTWAADSAPNRDPGRVGDARCVRPGARAAGALDARPAARTWWPCPRAAGSASTRRSPGPEDGSITGYALDVIQEAGAYPMIGAFLPNMTMRMLTGCYDIANVGFRGRSVATNTMSTTAFRGAGRPEATVAIERMIDPFAAGSAWIPPRCGSRTWCRGSSSAHDRHRHGLRRG